MGVNQVHNPLSSPFVEGELSLRVPVFRSHLRGFSDPRYSANVSKAKGVERGSVHGQMARPMTVPGIDMVVALTVGSAERLRCPDKLVSYRDTARLGRSRLTHVMCNIDGWTTLSNVRDLSSLDAPLSNYLKKR